MHMDWANHHSRPAPLRAIGGSGPVSLAPPLSTLVQQAARRLADSIEAGEYRELMPQQRTELRLLSLRVASWADQIETMEIERLPARGMPALRGRLAHILGKLRRR